MKMMHECKTDKEFKEWLEEAVNYGSPTKEEQECMRTYFSHCRFTPEGIARRNRWIDICIRLLSYLIDEGQNIQKEQIRRMNTRNLKGLTGTKELNEFLTLPKNDECRAIKAEEFYKRKIARLYHLIRLHKSHEWWE